jgi:leucyl aminopeptidase
MAKKPSAPRTTEKRSVTQTTKKSTAKAAPKAASGGSPRGLFGLALKTWVSQLRKAKGTEARTGRRGFVIAVSHRDPKKTRFVLKGHLQKWQEEWLAKEEGDSIFFHGLQGPVWLLRTSAPSSQAKPVASSVSLEKSSYARFRDLAGAVVGTACGMKIDKLILDLIELDLDSERGIAVGLEMASYSYAESRPENPKARRKLPALLLKSASSEFNDREIKKCAQTALSINIARHLVNVPGGELNPRTYAEAIQVLFAESSTVQVEVWSAEKLVTERMNLLCAVGNAAAEGPRFVHLRYRPKAALKRQPVAIVGKGITFDSGGLDLKPSSGMRLMKKDMGGSAAAVAIMKWAEATALELPLDVYVSLAENAVGSRSFRPGDVISARSGQTVEIHNTDAEGRLVLADALDVAVSQTGDDRPSAVIDLATLTGAIKVALGGEIAGLFSNNDELASQIETAGLSTGDLSWRMPLFQPYKSMLRSTFADYANSSDGFAGAITAALFLEVFVKDVPWAHLDIYAWKESAGGAWSESGGSGQPVQALAKLLTTLAMSKAEG